MTATIIEKYDAVCAVVTIQKSAKIETTRISTNPVPRYCHIFVLPSLKTLLSHEFL